VTVFVTVMIDFQLCGFRREADTYIHETCQSNRQGRLKEWQRLRAKAMICRQTIGMETKVVGTEKA
jgi:hypothetical protein